MFSACMSLCKGEVKRRIRALTITAALSLFAVAALLVAFGFGLSLLTVWLQNLYGTMPALAIVGGGCAALALILFVAAFWRPASRPKPRPVHSDSAVASEATGIGKRAIDDAINAVQQGSRETMLAALALAVVAGVTMGRKL
jgi:type VI protein secretion system component VasK